MVGGLLPITTEVVLVRVGDEVDVGNGGGRLFLENWLIPQWSFMVLKMWFRAFPSTEFDVGVLGGIYGCSVKTLKPAWVYIKLILT